MQSLEGRGDALPGTTHEPAGSSAAPYAAPQVTLTNSGDLDAVAVLSSSRGGMPIGTDQWTAPAHTCIDGSGSYPIPGCGSHVHTHSLDSAMKA